MSTDYTTGLDPEDLEDMLQSLDGFVEQALPEEKMLELDHEDVCPEDIVRAMSDAEQLGIQLVFVSDDWGGLGGGAFDAYRVCEAMGRHDIGLATAVFATFLGSDPIMFGGTDEQKAKYLGGIAEEGWVFAYGATEPDAGSDLGAMKTVAKRVTDKDGNVTGYKISGAKQWISNGGIADYCTILAMAPDGPSWFVAPRTAKGLDAGKPEDKHGIRLSNTAALFLDDVEVPAEDLLGGIEGRGLTQAQLVFGYTRLMVASFGMGGGWEALDRAIRYSAERIQGGEPLSHKQGFTHKLIVPHAVKLEAARAFIEYTAHQIDTGNGQNGAMNTEGAIAKYMATEAGCAAAEDAIQAHGGNGYVREYLVEKIKRDVRITTIYEGTSEIMEMTIARDRWQMHLKTKGRYYRDMADGLRSLNGRHPDIGANVAALACDSLAAVLDACRTARLTRSQHILFRLGQLMAYAECAAAAVQRTAARKDGNAHAKSPRRFDPNTLAAISRVFAREAAIKIALDGSRWVAGALAAGAPDVTGLLAGIPQAEIQAAQAGMVEDMDQISSMLYASAKG